MSLPPWWACREAEVTPEACLRHAHRFNSYNGGAPAGGRLRTSEALPVTFATRPQS